MYLNVLQNQWLALAMFGGLVMLVLLVLLYIAIWKPRETAEETAGASEQHVDEKLTVRQWLRSFMPWFLIFVYVAVAVYWAVYVVMQAVNPQAIW